MGILERAAVEWVYHYAPLHYLPFIARSQALLCKPAITTAGFPDRHIRSMSKKQDIARGFGGYVHLTLDPHPNILRAKLQAGFPHVKLMVPASVIDAIEFSLCRYNVAMTRYLRKDGKPGFPESPTNGYYYEAQQIPVARLPEHKSTMLNAHLGRGTMIEVLVHGSLELTEATTVVCFCAHDFETAQRILGEINCGWECCLEASSSPYVPNAQHVNAVQAFIETALANPAWRGNGLEFDRI